MEWTCQYKGCQSSSDQIAALRSRKPDGFPHDEDSNLRVCTVCRRLPLKEQSGEGREDKLDTAFLEGIREELGSIEENEKNIQALSQVFRYYTKYAKQLAQMLTNFAVKECFPWEVIHAMRLVDDILLMDNTGRYKAELTDRVQGISVKAFSEVTTDIERREIARMLQTWLELKIFEKPVLEAIKSAIRNHKRIGAAASKLLDEVNLLVDDDPEEVEAKPTENGNSHVKSDAAPENGGSKRKREESEDTNVSGAARPRTEAVVPPKVMPATQPSSATVLATVQRINGAPLDRPFEVLGIPVEQADGHAIRKAYRKIALIIHPDKNPGIEKQCQEALIKLQQAREQAETDLQRMDVAKEARDRGETRSAAKCAKHAEGNDGVLKCRYENCDLPPCKQCANGCCTRNITHCHVIARSKGGMQCFFHPPPRAWARNA